MRNRRQLRSRVLMFTALYALMLFAIAFVLTWRSREAQRRADKLISVDMRAISTLTELIRNQSAFQAQWKTTAIAAPDTLEALAARHRAVSQLLDSPALQTGEVDSLRKRIFEYEQRQQRVAAVWPAMTPDAQSGAIAELEANSRALTREAQALVMSYQSETERELPALERQAEDMMWIALAIAYIIAIMSFAIARLTLAKVVRPIEQLANAAEAIAGGDLTARAPMGGDREVAQLGASFNRMADALSRSYAELRERARTDELTGLPNFRAFRDTIDAELERAARYEYPVGVLVLDLDHFKKFNDSFGHLAGNDALQAAAKMIRAKVRVVDFPARYGGEEFAVILPQTDPLSMHRVAERIRTGIETMPHAPERTGITVSIGGAIFPVDGRTPEQLFKVADDRLYEAKERGRNCTVVPEGVAAG